MSNLVRGTLIFILGIAVFLTICLAVGVTGQIVASPTIEPAPISTATTDCKTGPATVVAFKAQDVHLKAGGSAVIGTVSERTSRETMCLKLRGDLQTAFETGGISLEIDGNKNIVLVAKPTAELTVYRGWITMWGVDKNLTIVVQK